VLAKSLDTVRLLVNAGADEKATDLKGFTPLSLANYLKSKEGTSLDEALEYEKLLAFLRLSPRERQASRATTKAAPIKEAIYAEY
jgi:hypothetical protein